MSCKVAMFNQCRLIQEVYRPVIFDFKNIDISDDGFIYSVNKYLRKEKQEFPTAFIDQNQIYVEPFDLPVGEYEHELIWVQNDQSEVVFQGRLSIVEKGDQKDCCSSQEQTIEVIREDVVVEVQIQERIINNIVWNGGMMHFEVNENMELIMYETVASGFDFNLNNGYLTLNFN